MNKIISNFYRELAADDRHKKRSFYAQTTVQQLTDGNPMIPFSWGLDDLRNIPCEQYKGESTGLVFTVNGLIFQGIVLITLDWDDTYNIKFFADTQNGYEEELSLEKSMIYCDQMQNIIDKTIETK